VTGKQRPLAGNQGGAGDGANVNDSLPVSTPAYVAVVVSPYGNPRRRTYLSLHHAAAAVARARGKGQQAWLVLCELRPVQAVLHLDGEVTG
jgi:hypothetical protein